MNNTTSISADLRALTNSAERLLAEQLRPIGITVAQMEFLGIFAANPGYSGADAAKDAHVTPQTGSTVLHNLITRRLVTVKQKPGSGHRNTITVTKAGTEALAQAQEAVADVEKRLRALLGTEAAFLIPAATNALQPYLPHPAGATHTSSSRPKTPTPKAKKSQPAAISAGAKKLDLRCRQWTSTMSENGALPSHVALQFGTQAQVDQLVAAGRWTANGDIYRINN